MIPPRPATQGPTWRSAASFCALCRSISIKISQTFFYVNLPCKCLSFISTIQYSRTLSMHDIFILQSLNWHYIVIVTAIFTRICNRCIQHYLGRKIPGKKCSTHTTTCRWSRYYYLKIVRTPGSLQGVFVIFFPSRYTNIQLSCSKNESQNMLEK